MGAPEFSARPFCHSARFLSRKHERQKHEKRILCFLSFVIAFVGIVGLGDSIGKSNSCIWYEIGVRGRPWLDRMWPDSLG
jgi:hypothetical protein